MCFVLNILTSKLKQSSMCLEKEEMRDDQGIAMQRRANETPPSLKLYQIDAGFWLQYTPQLHEPVIYFATM